MSMVATTNGSNPICAMTTKEAKTSKTCHCCKNFHAKPYQFKGLVTCKSDFALDLQVYNTNNSIFFA